MELVSSAQMREIDRLTIEGGHVSGPELMERAGLGIFELIRDRFGGELEGRRIVIACGKGNNGGDGFVVARHLMEQGAGVSVFVLAGDLNLASDARVALHQLIPLHPDLHKFADPGAMPVFEAALDEADLVVDALFGTGISAPLREPGLSVVRRINARARRVLSVDVPSGLSGDLDPEAQETVRAALTVTVGLPKLGLYHYPGREAAGEVEVVDIGFPRAVIEALGSEDRLADRESVRPLLPRHDPSSHKYQRGTVLIVAGSRAYGGAPLLTAGGALRGGAGMVKVALPASLVPLLQDRWPSAIAVGLPEDESGELAPAALPRLRELAGQAQAVALGPGLGRGAGVRALIRDWLADLSLPALLDADALFAYRDDYETLVAQPGFRVLTPHSGELAGLLGLTSAEVGADRRGVLRAARRANVVLLHKGAPSEVIGPDGLLYTVAGGHPWTAKGGAGDVLTGLVGALLAQRPADPGGMCRLGAWVHAAAGLAAARSSGYAMCAEDLIGGLFSAWREIVAAPGSADSDPVRWR